MPQPEQVFHKSKAETSATWKRLCEYLPYFVDLRNYVNEKCFCDSLCTESIFGRSRVWVSLEIVSPVFIEEVIKPWVYRWHDTYRAEVPKPLFWDDGVLEIALGDDELQCCQDGG